MLTFYYFCATVSKRLHSMYLILKVKRKSLLIDSTFAGSMKIIQTLIASHSKSD